MWHAKNTGGYVYTTPEGVDNTDEIYNILSDPIYTNYVWDFDSICAALGNICGEGGLNPWRWENDDVPTTTDFANWTPVEAQNHGYGLFGFTPASNYINATNASRYSAYGYDPNFSDAAGSPDDGFAQMLFMLSVFSTYWNYRSPTYVISYYGSALQQAGFTNDEINAIAYMTPIDFIYGNYYGQYRLDVLTAAYCCHFEAPGAQYINIQGRVTAAYLIKARLERNPPEFSTQANTWKFYLY